MKPHFTFCDCSLCNKVDLGVGDMPVQKVLFNTLFFIHIQNLNDLDVSSNSIHTIT